MTLPDYSMVRAAIKHIKKYIDTRDEHYLHLAGFVITMAPNQSRTLHQIAFSLASPTPTSTPWSARWT